MSCPPGYSFNGTECMPCPDGYYKTGELASCIPHTNCTAALHRMTLAVGNAMMDNLCGNCQFRYVNPDYMRTANDPKTICQLCEDASPEARALYPTGWCQQIVTKDTSAHSQAKFIAPTVCAVIFAIAFLLLIAFILYKKYTTPPFPQEERRPTRSYRLAGP